MKGRRAVVESSSLSPNHDLQAQRNGLNIGWNIPIWRGQSAPLAGIGLSKVVAKVWLGQIPIVLPMFRRAGFVSAPAAR